MISFSRQKSLESFMEAFAADGFNLNPQELHELALHLHRTLLNLPPFLSFMMRLTFWMVEYAIPPLAWKFKPAQNLPLPERVKYLHQWNQSTFGLKRTMFMVLKHFCVTGLYSHPRVLQEIGYGSTFQERIAGRCSSKAPHSERM